jgi:hypothetical protein
MTIITRLMFVGEHMSAISLATLGGFGVKVRCCHPTLDRARREIR